VLDFIRIKDTKTKLELENAHLKIKNIEATYQHLKQQVNPHFLFNSLTTLNTLIRKQPEKAEIYLKKLSDFLRVSITLNNENSVMLSDELKVCMNYLELQKVRFGDALQYNMLIPEEAESGFVPLFSVQLLLENAIKHNLLTSESPLFIEVGYDKGWLKIRNNIQVKNTRDESTGMGLVNLSDRYKILSGDEIVIQSTERHFSVSIKILSHENRNHRG
jgi:LytS/YehU family sensor histidine kinase